MVPHKFKDTVKLILIIIAIFLISYIINYINNTIITQKQAELLNDIKNLNKTANNEKLNEQNIEGNTIYFDDENIKQNNEKVIEKNERMSKIETLQKENTDIKGWIEIPGTQINYPVLQGTDNEYYVNHNYNKTKTKSGAIFVDMMYNWDEPSTNMIIYGHNMKNGTMFTDLMNYKKQEYFKQHQTLRFTTATKDNIYEIISVFESKIYKNNEDVFKYYNFINANNEEEFNNFIMNIKELSIYDTEKTAIYGEELITMSTCAYHTKDGRFVVVAKKGNSF